MRKILSYVKSHIYDIHAMIVGAILIIFIYFIKSFLQRKVDNLVERKLKDLLEIKIGNQKLRVCFKLVWLVVLMSTAIVLFAVLSIFSPFVDFSLQSGIMSGAYALCGNAFLEQILQNGTRRNK